MTRAEASGHGVAPCRIGERNPWVRLAIAAIAIGGCADDAADSPADRGVPSVENVLVVCVDTLRADRLGLYGYGPPTSPAIDRFFAPGVVFDQARSASPHTAPSHATLFTSLYPTAHDVVNDRTEGRDAGALPDGVVTLAEVLRDAGFETAGFVSGGNLSKRWRADRGFSTWDEKLEGFDRRIDAFLEWLGRRQDRRFFALLHTYQVHAPYLPPPDLVERFTDASYDGPMRERVERMTASGDTGAARLGDTRDYWGDRHTFDDDDVAFLSGLYDAEIALTDREFARLIDRLEAGGHLDRTLVVLLSDHGEEFMDHGRFAHDQVFEELLHVPLLLRFPDESGVAARRVNGVVELLDVAPTLVDLVGLPAPRPWAGMSLRPAIQTPAEPRGRPSFAELMTNPGPRVGVAVRSGRFKLIDIEQRGTEHRWRYLFDLSKDPAERNNLFDSNDPSHVQARRRLREEIRRRRALDLEMRGLMGGALERGVLDPDDAEALEQLGY